MLDWLKGKPKAAREAEPPVDMDFEELNDSPNPYYVVDLRDLTAYRQGHIKGSHLIPYMELTKRMHELPKNQMIVAVDASERRGRQAAKLLRTEGFRAHNLKGGIAGWTGKLVK
ncbi:MAG: rhodanese-like domain-containing protein [Firmicutes bacterium]|nr:rhodanese-like domain-containing protein [Bacillota bacterium]